MNADARRIWREIVAGKPVDWFDAGSLQTLCLHCHNMVGAMKVGAGLARVDAGTPEFRALAADARTLASALAHSNRQLRLTVAHKIDAEEKISRERGVLDRKNSHVVGGRALRVVDRK
jgi:hypothetical protein